ncbi:MAG: DNA-directed RNA polymerase subunit B'' [Candidatus Micrarchaeia archaeon]
MANEDKYLLLDSYLSTNSIVQHQIDSYNRFIELEIQKIIDSNNLIEPNVEGFGLKLGRIRLEKPVVIEADSSRRILLPNEARLRNLTYAAPMFLEITPIIRGIEKRIDTTEVFIGELPVMVGSNLCHTKTMTKTQLIENGEDPEDPGGYFIIKGTERVLIGLEDLAPNRILTTKEKDGSVTAKIFSTSPGFRARTVVTRNLHGYFTVEFPTSKKGGVELYTLLKALGMSNEEITMQSRDLTVFRNDMLLNREMSPAKDMSANDAMLEIGIGSAPGQAKEYQLKRAETQIDSYLLPHLGTTPQDRKEKAIYLLQMARKACKVANNLAREDDKDHYANRRIKFAGQLMNELFTYAFKFFVKDVKYQVERSSARGRKLNVSSIVSSDTLTEKIAYAMGTGTWTAGQTGVSQVLDRTNLIDTYAHLRRVKSPLAKKRPHFPAREVHGTQWGKICISETPEGQEAGLTKYLAILAKISSGAEESSIKEQLSKFGLEKRV